MINSMDCPWNNLPQETLTFCEGILCSWIKQPGNAWSNIGFFIGAWFIFKESPAFSRSSLRCWAFVSGAIGVGSLLFHVSGTKIGGILDLGSMLLATGLMTGLNSRRYFYISQRLAYVVSLVTAALLLGAMCLFSAQARWIYALGAPCMVLEILIFVRDRREITYRWFLWSFVVGVVGAVAWWLDNAKILCDPNGHLFSGHAAWHLLMALAVYFDFKFYRQFEGL